MTQRTRLAYTVAHEAWHWPDSNTDPALTAEITVALEALGEDGHPCGYEWEFLVTWRDTAPGLPEVCLYDEAWPAFRAIPRLFYRLADLSGDATPQAVAALLTELGFTDTTPRINPADVPSCSMCPAPAVYEIRDAPADKGNRACLEHRALWPLSVAVLLQTASTPGPAGKA